MDAALVLLLGGIASAIVGLVGVAEMRKSTPMRLLLSEAEKKSLDIQMMVSEGKHLCQSCSLRYTRAPFCEICEQLYVLQTRQVQTEPREPEQIVKNKAVRGTRSHVGYRPIYMRDGFEDMFQQEEQEE